MDSPGVQWILHCLSHKHMHQSCCFVNAKTQLTQPLEKIHRGFRTLTTGHVQKQLCPSFHFTTFVCCWWDCLRAAFSTYGRQSQQANPALLHWAEVPKCLDPKQASVRSALPEQKILSEVAEHQQSQSCFHALLHAPAMSNNSRFVYRLDIFRLISWEISLNTFSLLPPCRRAPVLLGNLLHTSRKIVK